MHDEATTTGATERADGERDEASVDGSELMLAPLSTLPDRDRALLTPEVIARWTQGLAPDDRVDPREIVKLERGRRQTLQTIRVGAELTDLEFKLLRYFQRNERQTLSYQKIAHHLWGTRERPVTAYLLKTQYGYASPMIRHIWQLMAELRRKLEIDPWRPQHFATVKGVGYRFYNRPPSLDDGENYERRATEAGEMRAQLRYDFGLSQEGDALPPAAASRFSLGPEHPDYQETIEADVTARSSRPRPSPPTATPPAAMPPTEETRDA